MFRKLITVIVCLLSLSGLNAQASVRIQQNIESFDQSNVQEINGMLKKVNNNFKQVESKHVSKAEYFKLDQDCLVNLLNSNASLIQFELNLFGESYTIQMYEKELLAPSYILNTATGKIPSNLKKKKFYHGLANNDASSIVSLSIFDDQIKMFITTRQGKIEFSPFDNTVYAAYFAEDLKKQSSFTCYADEIQDNAVSHQKSNLQRSLIGDCIEVYAETDFHSYQDNNSSIAETEAWILALWNEVAVIYDNESIPVVVSEIFVWDVEDPYANLNTPGDVLYEFDDQIEDNYNGRLAHWMSTRGLGGGVAWLDALCATYNSGSNYGPYAVSTSLSTNVVPYPNYSWSVMVLTHEMGHNLGSPHTHACAWNGNNTAIDGCGPEAGYSEGCDADLPDAGTIMSYCHLVGGVGIDPSLGFGEQPGDLVYGTYINATCVTGEDCAGVPPQNDFCEEATQLIVSLSCTIATFDNLLVSPSGENPGISCGNPGVENDVWFKVIVPVSGHIIAETKQVTNGLSDLIMEAYSGSCGSLSSIACDDNSGDGNHAKLDLNGLTPTDEIFLRVVESGSNSEGDFGICVYDPNLSCGPVADILVEFYNSTDGANWVNNAGWEDGAAGNNCDFCTWHGVSCNGSGEITKIELDHNDLNGTVPSSIGNITTLEVFDIWVNQINDPFPTFWDQLPNITYLDLSNNNFTDPLPANLATLNNATTMWFENNALTGTIPVGMGDIASLDIFYLNNNNLSGCFPDDLMSKCGLQYVQFDNNSNLPGGGDFDSFCNDGTGGDLDGDGYCSGLTPNSDCDDNRSDTYPGAPELCDGYDNDCNNLTDEGINCVSIKIYLGGPYNDQTNLHGDELRELELIPELEPFTAMGISFVGGGLEQFDPIILEELGDDAIVDWMYLELRNKNDFLDIKYSRSALLQKDGDIVDTDGISPVDFPNIPDDDYYLVINHRNHLGVMTLLPVDLSGTSWDLTLGIIPLYGLNAMEELETGIYGLWPGDSNLDKKVSYNGASNDKNNILSEVGLFSPNTPILGVYNNNDTNMDGDVRYNGASNDKNVILSSVGLFSQNAIIEEQIPE